MSSGKSRQGFLRALEDARKMLKEAKELWNVQGTEALIDIQRRLHTVKGNLGFFYIDSVTGPAGEAELGIEQLLKDDSKDYDVGQAIAVVAESIERFAIEHRELVGATSANERVVGQEAIKIFEPRLTDKELMQSFRESFCQAKVGDYFASYPEYAKNIAKRLGKKVRFELKGADVAAVEGPWTEVLSELIHVLRNSLDHGIETPKKRLAAGKPEEGLLRFSFGLAEHKGGRYLKAVLEDDGKGIDAQALARKDPRIQDMDSAIQFLAAGGLSSKEQATDLSGRGVGLSAVVQKTERLGGYWKVDSKEGKGTVIELLIPLESRGAGQERAA